MRPCFAVAFVLTIALTPGAAVAGTPSPREQAEALYRAALAREADPAGRRSWTSALAQGTSVRDAYVSMLFCAERQATRPWPADAQGFVTALGQELLGRSLEPGRVAAETARLVAGSVTREGLARELLREPELEQAHHDFFDTI